MAVDFKALRERYNKEQTMIEEQEDGAVYGKQVFDFDSPDIEFWKPEYGLYWVDLLPFPVGRDYPDTKFNKGAKAPFDYKFEYWVHRGVGPNRDNYICKYRMGMGKCPICEEYYAQLEEYKKEFLAEGMDDKSAFKAAADKTSVPGSKHRVVYNINIAGEELSPKILESSYAWTQKEFSKAYDSERQLDPDIPHFADPLEGMSLKLSMEEGNFAGRSFTQLNFRDFRERKKQYSEAVLEKTIDIGSLMYIPTDDEMVASMNGVVTEPPVVESTPPKVEEKVVEEQPKEEVVETPTEVISREERMKKLASKKKSGKPECPAGGTFGEDYCAYDDCEECALVEECGEASGVGSV